MRRPRLLLDLLPYHPADGGFATAVHHLLASAATFTDIEVVGVSLEASAPRLRQFGPRIVAIRAPAKSRHYVGLTLLPVVARALRADALHAEVGPAPVGLGVPTSVTVHDLHVLSPTGRPPTGLAGWHHRLYWRRLYVASLRRALLIKTISAATARDIEHHLGNARRVRVLRPYVDAPPALPVRTRWPVDTEELRVLFLGSVVPRRNLPFLLDALRQVRRPWRLDVVGSRWWGSDDAMTTDPRVTFHGFVEDVRRDRFLAQADVLVCPSVQEGFSYPVAEAMVRGTPVLVADIPVFREYVPDECRFPLTSPTQLAQRIDALSASEMARISPLLREITQRFSPEEHAATHHAYFAELLGMR